MGEIRPVSTGKRKGPLLSRVLVLSRISAPISTLVAFQRIVLVDANAFGELLVRHIKAAHLAYAATYLRAASLRAGRTLGLTSSLLLPSSEDRRLFLGRDRCGNRCCAEGTA
jgi:hypothetical protein